MVGLALVSLPTPEPGPHVQQATLAFKESHTQGLHDNQVSPVVTEQPRYLALAGHLVGLQALQRSFLGMETAVALQEAALEVNPESVTGALSSDLSRGGSGVQRHARHMSATVRIS